jgi:hypothetical protein
VPEGEDGKAYPHRNDAKAANQLIGSFVVFGVGVWVSVAVGGVGLAWGVKKWLTM